MKRTHTLALAATALCAVLGAAAPASAQVEPYIGQISVFGGNFCPRGWTQASGQIVAIRSNTPLFALYGTIYGGDGTVTFALPNLNDRAPAAWSNNNPIGEEWGASTTTLITTEMPMHRHTILAASTGGATNSPAGAALATFPAAQKIYSANPPSVMMNPAVMGPAGGNQPFSTQSPVLAMTWCVATTGIYPSRP